MRQVASLLAGAAIGALGGLVLGEYPFTGWTPYVAGVLFALVVTEVMLTISRSHGPLLGIGGGVFSAGGLGWAVWISSGRGIEPIPGGGWIAIALGFVVAMVRGFLPNRRTAPARPADEADEASPLDLLDEFIAPPGSATIVGSPTVRVLERERRLPEPPGDLAAPEEFATASGDPDAVTTGASEAGPKATARAATAAASKPASKPAPKAASKAAAKAPSKATATAASRPAVKGRSGPASSSAKKAPAKSGAKTSGGGGKSTAAGKASRKAPEKASEKAGSPARGRSSRTGGNAPAKAVKKAESPAPRSRKGGR